MVAQHLAKLDLAAAESASIVGDCLLREPGSLPSLPSARSGRCPLAAHGRADEGEITLSQEALRSGRAQDGLDGKSSPGEKNKRRLADSLVTQAQCVQQLRDAQTRTRPRRENRGQARGSQALPGDTMNFVHNASQTKLFADGSVLFTFCLVLNILGVNRL